MENGYRIEVLILLRRLERLDKDPINEEERQEAEEVCQQHRCRKHGGLKPQTPHGILLESGKTIFGRISSFASTRTTVSLVYRVPCSELVNCIVKCSFI